MKNYLFLFILLVQVSGRAQSLAAQGFILASQTSKDELDLAQVAVQGDSLEILNVRKARISDGDWNDFEHGRRIQFKLSDSEYVEIRDKTLSDENFGSHKTTTDIFTDALNYKKPRTFSVHLDKNDPLPIEYCYKVAETTNCLTSQLVRRLNLGYQNKF